MKKADLIAKIAEKSGMTRRTRRRRWAPCSSPLRRRWWPERRFSWWGFGTFEVKERAARSGLNPRTGDTIEIAAAKVPAFKAGKMLKDKVNQA